jgi:hypothetical protein
MQIDPDDDGRTGEDLAAEKAYNRRGGVVGPAWPQPGGALMRIRSQALQRRRAARQGRKVAKRQHRIEKEMAKQTELRHRDEHTGGYGDSP